MIYLDITVLEHRKWPRMKVPDEISHGFPFGGTLIRSGWAVKSCFPSMNGKKEEYN